MSQYIEFVLPDGSTVVLESDGQEGGLIKTGAGDVAERARETFEQAVANAQKAVLIVLDKARSELSEKPDEIEVTYGLKASGELGCLVVAKAGVEASYSVKLTWKH